MNFMLFYNYDIKIAFLQFGVSGVVVLYGIIIRRWYATGIEGAINSLTAPCNLYSGSSCLNFFL